MRKKRSWNMSNPLFRYLKSKKSKSRASSSVTTQMARRKKSSRRKSYFRRASRRASSSSSTGNLLMTVGASMLYGAGREKLSNMTAQYLPRFVGDYTDEVALGALGWYLSKKGGIIGSLGKSALIIESARVGSMVGSQVFSTTSATVSNSNYYA